MTDAPNANARKILTTVGIANWVFLAQPFQSRKYADQPPKYKLQVLLNPNTPDGQQEIGKIKTAQREIALATWAEKTEFMLGKLGATDSLALHDGNLQDDEHAKGMLFIGASVKKPPAVLVTLAGGALKAAIAADPNADWAQKAVANNVSAANVPIKVGHPMFPYPGCKVAMMYEMYVYNKESFACQLMGVQFIEHGRPFLTGGGAQRIASVEEFGINPVDADVNIPMQQPAAGAASGLF